MIEAHLRGVDARASPFMMGAYPLQSDDKVSFAVIDFDKKTWRTDSWSVCKTLQNLGLPVARERSRSGNGAHLWFFFAEPIPAAFVRDALTYVLTLTMEQNPEIGLDSYDSIFPNQDRLPKGGFGNLIALPLQRAARLRGNSCFVDERLVPFPDQWKFLSTVPFVSEEQLRSLRSRAYAEKRTLVPQRDDEVERLEPWSLFTTSPTKQIHSNDRITGEVVLTLANAVYIDQQNLNPTIRGRLIRLVSFVNPAYAEAQRMRRSVHNIPRVIDCSLNGDDYLVLPRGCLESAQQIISRAGGICRIVDKRQAGKPLVLTFQGELRLEQKEAARILLKHDVGVLAAGTAFGKTVLATWIIAARQVNTLVLVNRRQLQDQWVTRLSNFLEIDKKSIGRFGGGTHQRTFRLDVALVQSLARKDDAFLVNHLKDYGQIIVDECHAISSPTFEKVTRSSAARYFLGLSATVIRKDGHHPIIEMQCGPVRHRVNARQMVGYARFNHVVYVRTTSFVPPTDVLSSEGKSDFATVVDTLLNDTSRNELIVRDVLSAVREGRSPVILSERREHLYILHSLLEGKVEHLILLRGGMGRRQFQAIRAEIETIPSTESRVLLATGSYLGEGIDDARLDTLFLVLPISWNGRIVQYAGRLHRRSDGKREVRIYDYIDTRVAVCRTMFNRRCKGYAEIGYTITAPNDMLEGWPSDIPIPVELRSSETYADTIKRLSREGVGDDVADLFVYAAQQQMKDDIVVVPLDSDGTPLEIPENTARSSPERFLFRYLESNPRTKGYFKLNGRLEIPFGPNPYMEVDLRSRHLRIAVEINGKHHFATPENYRRDRRKDYLLQDAGYFVIRVLAEDVVEHLDFVMDIILSRVAKIKAALLK